MTKSVKEIELEFKRAAAAELEQRISDKMDTVIDKTIADVKAEYEEIARQDALAKDLTQRVANVDENYHQVVLLMIKSKEFDLADSSIKGLSKYTVWMKKQASHRKHGLPIQTPTLKELFGLIAV